MTSRAAFPAVIGGEKLTLGGNMKLTHPTEWFLVAGEPMLKAEGRMELAVLPKHGASIRELAPVTGHSRNTVRRYLRGGETAERRKAAAKRREKLDSFKDYIVARMSAASPARIPAAVLFREIKERGSRGGETAERRKTVAKRSEKLEGFKDSIVARMSAASPARIPAAVLFREIKERGYQGGETRVKQFVRTLVPAPVPEPIVRFETEPGEQMQADWATVGGGVSVGVHCDARLEPHGLYRVLR
jgi:transposase